MLAYLSRVKAIFALTAVKAKAALKANLRYAAYSSDVGEAARPVVPPWVVKLSYATVGVYVTGDIGYECYNLKNKHDLQWTDWAIARTAAHAATFQGIASIGIPFVLIHSAVKYSALGFAKYAPGGLKWGPSVVGLSMSKRGTGGECFCPFTFFCCRRRRS